MVVHIMMGCRVISVRCRTVDESGTHTRRCAAAFEPFRLLLRHIYEVGDYLGRFWGLFLPDPPLCFLLVTKVVKWSIIIAIPA